MKDIWWDVRPHPDFGTVEVRICDVPYCMRDILALTALVQELVVTLTEQQENPEPHMQILRTNKWQAARYGLEGQYIDPFFGKKCSMREALVNLYRYVKPASETLKSAAYLDEIPEILKRSTGAHIQKQIYYSNGNNFIEMIRTIQGYYFR